jgi:secreted PhoX family phosphatase
MDTDHGTSNPSTGTSLNDLIDREVSRRSVLKGGLGLATLGFFTGSWLTGCGSDEDAAPASSGPAERMLGFAPVATNSLDAITLPAGYTHQVMIPWGEPINAVAPAWLSDASQGWQEQEQQIGDNHDGMTYFGFNSAGTGPGTRSDEGLLVLNHEYINPEYFYKPGTDPADWLLPFTFDKVKKGLAGHGISVIHLRRAANGTWSHVTTSPYNRRVTGYTPMQLQGPAAGHALMRTAADPTGYSVLGTLNNCANGFTPWGTYLTCEENFNGYFGNTDTAGRALTSLENRYGVGPNLGGGLGQGFGYRWHTADPRFDINATPNEPNRHGWVVEIDPFNPGSTPVKRTALGRFKHENAEVVVAANGTVVVYMGDDERNEYIYKFVSTGTFDASNPYSAANRKLLESGTLYVAKFEAGATSGDNAGTGTWIPLIHDTNGLTAANGFADQAEVLIKARQAADRVGATMMDRPEWISANPKVSGQVFITLTNNNRRGTTTASSNSIDGTTVAGSARPLVDEANPRATNNWGHIIKLSDDGTDPTATTFAWDIFVIAGNPQAFPGTAKAGSSNVTSANMFNSPDGIGFDSFGRLWIQTDGNFSNAGDFAGQGNNQMLAADPVSKEIRRFLVGPAGCEITGLTLTPDRKTMFINIQHPGEVGSHPLKPAAHTGDNWMASNADQFSTWPGGVGSGRPRSATVVIRRTDGRPVGDGDYTAPAVAPAAVGPTGFMLGSGSPTGIG